VASFLYTFCLPVGWALAAALAAAAPRQAAHYGGALTLVLLSTAGRPARFVSLRQAFSRPTEATCSALWRCLGRRAPGAASTPYSRQHGPERENTRISVCLAPSASIQRCREAYHRPTTGSCCEKTRDSRLGRAFHAAKPSSSVSCDTSESHFLTPTLRLVALRNRSPREALQIIIGKLLRCVGERAAHA